MTQRDPATLRALAERLESGEAGREMDAAIAEVLGLVPQYYVRSTSYLYAHEPHYFLKWDASRPYTYSLSDAPWLPPHLTTSLDAAHALHEAVLDYWTAFEFRSAGRRRRAYVSLSKINDDGEEYHVSASSRCGLAAAWAAAILYALAEEAESER